MITAPLLKQIYGIKIERAMAWLPHLHSAIRFAAVGEDKNRLACFLAQVGHESGRLRYTREIWGPTPQQQRYEYGTTLAQRLGNYRQGDGKRYMGRGLIQTTGRLNYEMTTNLMQQALAHETAPHLEAPNFVEHPEALETPFWAAMSAALYWRVKGLNHFADKHDFITLTKRINGGINGLAERQALYSAAFGALVSV